MKKVYVDGANGIIGSKVLSKLRSRRDLELMILSEPTDTTQRLSAAKQADIIILSASAGESDTILNAVEGSEKVVIDATARFATNPDWVYGFAELTPQQEQRIALAKRITVPSVFGIGMLVLIKPLIDARMISLNTSLSCFCVCGYSLGGLTMAEQYKNSNSEIFKAPRQFNISQNDTVLDEVTMMTGLKQMPVFLPTLANYYSGVHMSIALPASSLQSVGAEDIKWVYAHKYNGSVIRYNRLIEHDSFISAASYMERDSMEVYIIGNEDRIVLGTRYDNLGKGSAATAVECLNIVMGVNHAKGLDL